MFKTYCDALGIASGRRKTIWAAEYASASGMIFATEINFERKRPCECHGGRGGVQLHFELENAFS